MERSERSRGGGKECIRVYGVLAYVLAGRGRLEAGGRKGVKVERRRLDMEGREGYAGTTTRVFFWSGEPSNHSFAIRAAHTSSSSSHRARIRDVRYFFFLRPVISNFEDILSPFCPPSSHLTASSRSSTLLASDRSSSLLALSGPPLRAAARTFCDGRRRLARLN